MFYKYRIDLRIEGDYFTDESKLMMYATDASAYREFPHAICWPKSKNDLLELISYAKNNNLTLIPRGAGTSLAGQVVGKGIVVDFSRYFTSIIELNEKENWVRVEPGVILDELNLFLSEYDLFFAPETSTSNRCVMGGMVGNNSSGLHSVIYGSTREHLISLKCILSDGSEVEFGELTEQEFRSKLEGDSLEAKLYNQINS